MTRLTLYSYWQSTTAIRARAALNLKGYDYDIVSVDLTKGEQSSAAYAALNPIKSVPTLILADGTVLVQSLAIIDYLDAMHPDPKMLPDDPAQRARVLAAALTIAQEIHPVNNRRVVQHLLGMGHTQDDAVNWMRHWMIEGFTAFLSLIDPTSRYCFGDTPDMADLCLVGQMYNARRWGVDLSPFKRLVAIDSALRQIDAINQAMPEQQRDAC